MFGVTRHWHKRIVRCGENTLETYRVNPADRVIADDDIVFLDFGPIFEEWEADFGRTFVQGDDPRKLSLCADLPEVWQAGDYIESYIAPGSSQPMRRNDRAGKMCHWILEVRLVDRHRRFGGFHEELLDLP